GERARRLEGAGRGVGGEEERGAARVVQIEVRDGEVRRAVFPEVGGGERGRPPARGRLEEHLEATRPVASPDRDAVVVLATLDDVEAPVLVQVSEGQLAEPGAELAAEIERAGAGREEDAEAEVRG